jgi:RHS repeat-associated protein
MMNTWRSFFAVAFLWWMTATCIHAQKVTYIYSDPQGTPLAEADEQGNITKTFDYRPYGVQALGDPPQGPGYTGHVNDPETDLVYMQARYYDSVSGRFLSVDPVGAAAGNLFNINRYAYANNSPLIFVDPNGRQAFAGWANNQVYAGTQLATSQQLAGLANISADFTPIVGDIKGIIEAYNEPTVGNVIGAIVGLVPFVGDAAKGGIKGSRVAKSVKPDFIVSRDGAVIHGSPDKVRASLDGAGFEGSSVTNANGTEQGTLHNISGMKMDIRVMDGGANHPARVVTTREGTSQPVNPTNGSNFGNVPKVEQRERSHIVFP